MVHEDTAGSDNFKLVTSRRKKKRSTKIPYEDKPADDSDEISVDTDTIQRRITEAKSELENSEYYKSVQLVIDQVQSDSSSIKKIICIGIGRFSQCAISRHQLAFILCLQEKLKQTTITFHEPILSKAEIVILQHLKCDVFAENLEGKVPIDITSDCGSTLVFAPHCPKQLTNNLIWKNWSVTALSNIILLANSFESIISATPTRFLKVDAKYILEVAPHTTEKKLQNTFKYTDIFNDLSIHSWSHRQLSALKESFWLKDNSEPKYTNNIELITSQLISKLEI